MAAIEGKYDGTHYVLSGAEPGPSLLLLNSLGSNLHMWDFVLPALEQRHRVLRYDMPGHGQSEPRPDLAALAQLGGQALALLDHLQLELAAICGISLGGLVGQWLGMQAPRRARRIVLANTLAQIGTPAGWDGRIAEVTAAGMEPVARATVGRWFTPGYAAGHPAEMEQVRAMVAATDAASYAGCCRVLRDTDLRGALGRIAAPCLVLTGAHDLTIPPAAARALAGALPAARYQELDAAHLSAWEQPQPFAAAVLDFLQQEENGRG